MAAESFAVLGGGIAGLCAARRLARRGCRVVLVEKKSLGAGATGKSAGLLNLPLAPRSPFQHHLAASFAGYAAFVEQLERESGERVDFNRCGMLYIAFEAADEKKLRGQLAAAQNPLARAEWREPERIALEVPLLTGEARGGLFLGGAARVHPPSLIRALRKSLIALGGRIEEGFRSVRLEPSGKAVALEREDGSRDRIAGFRLVVCAGAWTQEVLEGAGLAAPAPIVPIRGQMIELAMEVQLPYVLRWEDYYLIPRPERRLWVGSTVEEAGFDESVTEEGKRSLFQVARRLLPRLEGSIASAWAGLRPKALQRGGAILKAGEAVSILAGHYRSGILAAPRDADRLVRELLGDDPKDPSPFLGG